MTVLHHHLDGATLLRYASGDLDEAFSVVVATHLAMCSECRRAARAGEEVGGRFLEVGDKAELSAGSFDRLMQRIDDDGAGQFADSAEARHGADGSSDVPAPLRRFVGPSLKDIPWTRVAPGVRKHAINISSATSSSLYMLNIAPGRAAPEHGHGGAEIAVVLSGAYRDELGRFGPGDVADLDEHIEHQPKVEQGAACICIVATEAPTRFKGFFSRLLQPIVGI